jgi:AraC family transcriptional regulator
MLRYYETRHHRGTTMPMHRHREAYAALIVDGAYVETSVDGPVSCTPGTLVLHAHFHAHEDSFGRLGARVMNVTLPETWRGTRAEVLSVPHLREAMQILRCGTEHLHELLASSVPHESLQVRDWQQAFLHALGESEEPVGTIARRLGVSAAHASRELRSSFGMSPQALRRELRWRRSLELLATDVPLRDVAAQTGFADQSHFTRTVRAHSGHSPAGLRRHIKYIQDSSAGRLAE